MLGARQGRLLKLGGRAQAQTGSRRRDHRGFLQVTLCLTAKELSWPHLETPSVSPLLITFIYDTGVCVGVHTEVRGRPPLPSRGSTPGFPNHQTLNLRADESLQRGGSHPAAERS